MANKYVQYGAVVAAGVGGAGLAKGLGAATQTFNTYNSAISSSIDAGAINSVSEGLSQATSAALDTGISAAGKSIMGAVTSPSFLTGVGLGLAGLVLGSGSKRPSLNFPNLVATAAVGLNVANLIQQGKAAAASLGQTVAGKDIASKIGPPVSLRAINDLNDPTITTSKERENRKTYSLVYPSDLTSNYYIRLGLYRYQRLDKSQKTLSNSLPHTTIRLPIPANLIDAISLAYQDIGLGMFGGAAFSSIAGRLNGAQAPGNGQNEVFRLGTAAVGGLMDLTNDPSFLTALARRLASNISPTAGSLFDLATGTTPNPHMAVSFQGVSLKRYQFNWRLSPNNQKESLDLEKIIRNLQASALPEKDGKFLLTFPDVVKIEMMPSNMFIFKPMMIDNVSINYAPSGTPSFFKGEASSFNRYATELELSISLRELDIHTASDPDYQSVRNLQNISDPNKLGSEDPGYNNLT